MVINPKQKPYFTFVIFLALWLFLFYFIFKLDAAVDDTSGKIIEQKREIVTSNIVSNKIALLKEDINKNREDVENVQKVLIKPAEIVNFISELENIASLTSNEMTLTIDKIDKTEKKESKDKKEKESDSEFPALYFSLNISGTFPNLLKFLYLFENMPYWSDVYTFSIARFDDPRKEIVDQVETTLKIKVYTSL